MVQNKKRKNNRDRRFSKKMQFKLTMIFGLIVLAFIGLLVYITSIVVDKGNTYATKVLSQESYDSRTIPYRRGEIRDRNGVLLARSVKVYNLVLDCYMVNGNEIGGKQDYVEPTIRALVNVLGVDEGDVRTLLAADETKNSRYQVLRKEVTEEEKKAYEDYVSLDVDRELSTAQREELSNVQGIWFEEEYIRDYPLDSLGSNVIGFSNAIDQGVCGLEAYYDDILNGTDGREFGYLNENSEFKKTVIEPENGKTLISTLDVNIQEVVQKYIDALDEEYADGPEDLNGHGAVNIGVVVMDPNNGEILGMGTNSSFNLNKPQDLTSWYTEEEIRAMDSEEYVKALNGLWGNFCVSNAFELGSTFKPVTVASALECGAITDSANFYCDGGEYVTDTQINCDYTAGHGAETLEDAIKNSCNDALMAIGFKMGIDNFLKYQKLFNFGSLTGIDLPNENTGVLHTRDSMHEVELATCTFGQGFTSTMIQEAAAFCAVINGGYYYQPHVVKQVQNDDGSVATSMDGLLLRQPVSSDVSKLVRGYLETAVLEGTGRRAQVPGYRVGGKTGTAETIDPETGVRAEGKYVVSFIGGIPINDPKVVIYVVVDQPNIVDQTYGVCTQTLFRQVATDILPYMNIYPTEAIDPSVLSFLGITEEDVVKDAKQTFQAYDAYGNLYNNCYINDEGIAVNEDGVPLEGVTVNESGTMVTDAWGNQQSIQKEEEIDPKADNPNIATPPEADSSEEKRETIWDGITREDLLGDAADTAAED